MNNGQIGNNQAAGNRNGNMVIQPQQIQALAKQCNFEIQEARRLGAETPAGQEHLKKAQRIKAILIQYQNQQQQRQQQQPQIQQQQQQNRVASQQSPQLQQNAIASPSVQQVQSPQLQQQSPQIPLQSPTIQQTRQIPQQNNSLPQQPMIQRAAGAMGGAASSPSPLAQNIPPSGGSSASPSTQSSQHQRLSPLQQLTQIKTILSSFTKKLKDIEVAKASGTLSPEQLQKLAEQETLFRERFNSYKNAAIQITQQLQRQQAQQQQQQRQQQQQAPQQQQQQPQQAPQQQQQQPQQPQRPQPVQTQSQATINQARTMSNSSTPQLVQNQTPINAQNQLQQQQLQNTNITNNNNNGASQLMGQNIQFQSQQPSMTQQNQFTPTSAQQQIPTTAPTSTMSSAVGMPQISQSAPGLTQQQQMAQQKKQGIQQGQDQSQLQPQPRTGTPQPQGNILMSRGPKGTSASPNTPVTNVNAAAKPNGNNMGSMNTPSNNVFKTSVPSLPISNTVTPKQLQPAQVTQRPSMTGGQGLAAPALSTPAILKLPPYEPQSDRVLSKRKLSELVKTVGADEGDGETTIDGDVEELLLDLADEFVTNVTGFACRLAKHRKSDTLDVKDVQLHLEKNWNIRIPGYSADEIRNVRKWAPNSAHTQRIHGIGISKSVDQSK